MRSLPLVSAIIIFALGAACLAFAAREERRLRLLDPLKRTTATANYRQLRLTGIVLITAALSGLFYNFFGQP